MQTHKQVLAQREHPVNSDIVTDTNKNNINNKSDGDYDSPHKPK